MTQESLNRSMVFLFKIMIQLTFAIIFLPGCGAFVKVIELDDETARNLRAEVKYYEPNQVNSIIYEPLQPIEATSCKNKLWDPSPSRENAVDQLRYMAKSYGGNGITNVLCTGSEGTSLSKNCWNSITCNGLAIKVTQERRGAEGTAINGDSTSISKKVKYGDIHEIPDFKSTPRENDFAVIIGVERYQSLPSSEYSYNDALIMRKYLSALGYQERNIEFITDERATKSGIEKTIEAWLPNRVNKNSKVFLYYSGHGAPDPTTGHAHLVPYDGDPHYLSITGYSIDRLYDNLSKLQAKEIIVVLDACFSGAGGRSVLARGTRPIVLVTENHIIHQHMVVLMATQGMQISTSSPEKAHGLLTYYFLKSIKDGKSDIAVIYEQIKPQIENEAKMLNVLQSPSLNPSVEKIRGKFNIRLPN